MRRRFAPTIVAKFPASGGAIAVCYFKDKAVIERGATSMRGLIVRCWFV